MINYGKDNIIKSKCFILILVSQSMEWCFLKFYNLRRAAILNEEHLVFRVGCTDIGATNISLFTLFGAPPNSYNIYF